MTQPGRPDWDAYFLGIARAVAARADCTRRQVGAVVVRDRRIVSTGYNGAPPGGPSCLRGECPRGLHFPRLDAAGVAYCVCGEHEWPCPNAAAPGSSYDTGPGACVAVHAEGNAVLYAGRDGCLGSTLYVTDEPCDGCSKLIKASGIARLVWPNSV
ncbi:deoxycytidylate deaminase [Micromonospora avicenniae]|uniref:deoxycytidylate deaminase n=1 Tax=Micromonospora avicenniae TaxID=1198245 RepID=UPI003331B5BA